MDDIKILLVEDDNALATGIQYALSEEGYKVKWADSLSRANDILAREDFNLFLVDIMLPDGLGYDFLKEVKKNSDSPFIFLTARDEEVNIVMGLDFGADDYITKPFRSKELTARIRAVLRRSNKSLKTKSLSSGTVKIDIEKQKVYKGNTPLELTPHEFKLLYELIVNEGKVLKRSTLLEKIWDIDESFIDDNTLSVYIRRLREKIEDNPGKPLYIKTIRGIGYSWGGSCE